MENRGKKMLRESVDNYKITAANKLLHEYDVEPPEVAHVEDLPLETVEELAAIPSSDPFKHGKKIPPRKQD